MNIMSKNNVFLILKSFGLTILGSGALIACGSATKSNSVAYSGFTNGMPLIGEGVHLKSGEHNYVITQQFYYSISYESNAEQTHVMNALKEAYSNLNKYVTSLSFNLCTVDEDVASKFNIEKVDSIGEQDVSLYLLEDSPQNNRKLFKTNVEYDKATSEITNASVTYNKDYIHRIWKDYPTIDEMFNPYNTVAYTSALASSLQTMGFRSFNDHESIMNDLTENSPIDLTAYDIELLNNYCSYFYNQQ